MKLTARYIAAMYIVLSLLSGCQHKPVYPSSGAVYIESEPTGAEVLIDGESTKRQTPVKIDDISAGEHEISLRMFGLKLLRHNVTIEGGMTKRLYLSLHLLNPQVVAITKIKDFTDDAAFEPNTHKLYLANRSDYLYIFQIDGPNIYGPIESIYLGNSSWQRSVAVSREGNRIYACLWSDVIKAINFSTNEIIKNIPIPGAGKMKIVEFNNDGSLAFVADSLAKKIWIIDTKTDSLKDSICLQGSPSDLIIEPNNKYVYVTILEDKSLQEIDIISKTINRTAVTGQNPGGLFYNYQWTMIGFCNMTDLKASIIYRSNWAMGTGPAENLGGEQLSGACITGDNSYLWMLEANLPYPSGNFLLCAQGSVVLVYIPTWRVARRFGVGKYPIKIFQSMDGLYVYIVNNYTGDVYILRTDTE